MDNAGLQGAERGVRRWGGSGSPELAKSGTPVVGLSRGRAVEHARGTRDTLVALARHRKARGGARINGGGWAWQNIAGEWRSKH